MANSVFPVPHQVFLLNDGSPASLGSLTFLSAGTPNPATTWSDEALSIANPNPLLLNSAGRAEVSGTEITLFGSPILYDVILRDASGTIVYTAEDVQGQPEAGGALPLTFVVGDLLVANSTTTLTTIAAVAAGQVLQSTGVGNPPAYTPNPSVTSLTTSGDLTIGGGDLIATADLLIRRNTADGADGGIVTLTGAGAGPDPARGSYLQSFGNEAAQPGSIFLGLGSAATSRLGVFGAAGTEVFTIDGATGDVTVAGTITPLTGILTVDGDEVVFDPSGNLATIRLNTVDGSDNGSLMLAGAGGSSPTRGAVILIYGNEATTRNGNITLHLGNSSPSAFRLFQNDGVTEALHVPGATGNVGMGTSTFGTSAAKVLAILTGTAPSTAPADTVQIFSSDISAGNCAFSVFQEMAPYAGASVASTTRIPVRWNGTTYYLLATTVA